MDTVRICKQCLQPLSENAAAELCPQCLAAGPNPRIPPEVAELAPYFPQLEIIELLGMGGMGLVYKARQPQLNRLVALKILPLDFAVYPSFAERFSREARALARLNHPGIVDVYDFGRAGPYFYFIMEFVDGPNLRQLLDGKSVAPRETLELVVQICTALQFAHDEGVVHRDIKPANILVNKKGQAKIADFGLAKLLDAAPDAGITSTQAAMGTLNYMAPEQRENAQAVDHRADIFSLGVVFYEMLTGEVPMGRFEAPSKKVLVDVRLDEVVMRALEREPARRYQHASDLKSGVEAITNAPAQGPATPEPPAGRPRLVPSWRRWLPGSLLGLAAMLALAVWLRHYAQSVADFFYPPGPDQLVERATNQLERYDLPGHIDSAIKDLNKAMVLNDKLTEAHAWLGVAYWRRYGRSTSKEHRTEAWRAATDAWMLNSNSVKALLVRGLVAEAEKRPKEARDTLILANISAEGEDGEVLIGLAQVYADLKDMSNSTANVEKAFTVRRKPWYFFNSMGKYEFYLGDCLAAQTNYQEAVKLAPDSPIAWLNLGAAFLKMTNRNESAQAYKCLQTSLGLGKTEEAYNDLGLLFTRNERWPEAAQNFEAAAQINPDRYDFPGNKGLALIHLEERREEGRELLRKALNKAQMLTNDTQHSLVAANIGLYQAGLGETTNAFNTFRHELEASPDSPTVINNIIAAIDLLNDLNLPKEAERLGQLLPKTDEQK